MIDKSSFVCTEQIAATSGSIESISCRLFITSCPVSARLYAEAKVQLIYDVTTRPPRTSFGDKTTDFLSEINRIWKARAEL